MEEVSLQEATAESLCNQYRRSKRSRREHTKGSFHTRWKGKNILPGKERHDNVCHTLAVYLQTKLKPEYLPQTYGGGIFPWSQISLVGVRLTKPEMGICG